MKRSGQIDKSLRKQLISREDYPFFLILLISAIVHLSAAGYLSTIEIKKIKEGAMEVIKGVSPRFAKLILQPIEAAPKRVQTRIIRREAVKKEEVIASKVPSAVEEKGVPTAPAAPSAPERKGVGYKGLLGVIMAKARPGQVPGTAAFRDVTKIFKDIGKVGPEERGRVKDVLAGLSVKGIEGVEGVPEVSVGAPVETRQRETGEIIKEKREVLLEGVEKKKPVTDTATARKRYEAEVYSAILSYTGGLKYLYNNALRKDSSLKGRVTVRMVISPNGKAKEVVIVSSTLGSPELEEAIVNRIYMWRFPEFRWGESFTTIYTFDFSPVG